ncbi:hypothetical protein TRICI_002902 [Trichomonascus ciferrii]|uniref:C2H2-type domain-containing protein n=1 Tax=Trichomonascus ciferrii TaxID=44093 RepID=A0A642V5F0_9ASCO|nr:hypothetical protein TRICI_002902 [Trichomonascus ciferrii]
MGVKARRKKKTIPKPYRCYESGCSSSFATKWILERHVTIKHRGLLYWSTRCGKGFYNQKGLIEHFHRVHERHMGEIANVPSTAPTCYNENPRKSCAGCCDECDPQRTYGISESLNPELVCQTCAKVFQYWYFRMMHERVAHQGWRYRCGRCNDEEAAIIGYNDKRLLYKHYRVYHGSHLRELRSIRKAPPPGDGGHDEISKSPVEAVNYSEDQESHEVYRKRYMKGTDGCDFEEVNTKDGGEPNETSGASDYPENREVYDSLVENSTDETSFFDDYEVPAQVNGNRNCYVSSRPQRSYQHFSLSDPLVNFSEHKSLYFDHFNIQLPLLAESWFEGETVPASGVRSLASIGALLIDDVETARQFWEEGMSLLDELLCKDERNDRMEWDSRPYRCFSLRVNLLSELMNLNINSLTWLSPTAKSTYAVFGSNLKLLQERVGATT